LFLELPANERVTLFNSLRRHMEEIGRYNDDGWAE
jgi:hypothetical protein